jgi:choline kinase
MNAIIIAGGKSTRLRPLSNEIPKTMIEVYGKSVLERQVEVFQSCGISDITAVTGYHSEKVNLPNINCIKNEKYETTNVNEGLFCAKAKLSDSVIITYGDIIFENEVLEQTLNFKGDIGVVIDLDWKKQYTGKFGRPISEADNVIMNKKQILKISKNLTKKDDLILAESIGIFKLSKTGAKILLDRYNHLKKSHKGKFYSASSFKDAFFMDMIQYLIDTNVIVEPIPINGRWCEIDTQLDLERAKEIFSY